MISVKSDWRMEWTNGNKQMTSNKLTKWRFWALKVMKNPIPNWKTMNDFIICCTHCLRHQMTTYYKQIHFQLILFKGISVASLHLIRFPFILFRSDSSMGHYSTKYDCNLITRKSWHYHSHKHWSSVKQMEKKREEIKK